MTPETQHARTGPWGTVAQPSHAAAHPRASSQSETVAPSETAAKRLAEDASIVRAVPLLAVLVVTVAGVYVAWHQGSAGAGEGGVVGGAALLVAAVARLLLPSRLAGLLAMRKRANDVVTLTIFGVGLLVTGLVLPH
jgi:hypothetical protein